MTARLLELPAPDDANPHGRRYAPDDRERCYVAWRVCRSLRRVAADTDISPSTLATWSKDGGWVERARKEDDEEADAARSALAGRILPGANDAVAELELIFKDRSLNPMARVKAIELYLGYGGLAPTKQYVPLDDPIKAGRRTVTAAELLALDPDALTSWSPPTEDDDGGLTG